MAAHNDRPTVLPVPLSAATAGWDLAIAHTINDSLLRGKANNIAAVTLTANATETTLIDDRIGYFSHLSIEPVTAAAATARASLWWEATAGSATLHHASDAATDQDFSVAIFG